MLYAIGLQVLNIIAVYLCCLVFSRLREPRDLNDDALILGAFAPLQALFIVVNSKGYR